ncbi:hypothetical protein [Bacillus sp. UNC322MFChir4.1]|uniref:hypothetical protein n=1 Tax=Bacillus sp. UNC322MFChir4.1 TaxID=1449045 RepID=UPI000553DBF8|nr:hypothetical protein [Bacillus sp. UNC322MFChir4.1]
MKFKVKQNPFHMLILLVTIFILIALFFIVGVLKFLATPYHMKPSNFGSGRLILLNLETFERCNFDFIGVNTVKDLITGIRLQKDKLIVQVNDAYAGRKTQVVFQAPKWLVETYKTK